MKIQWSMIWTHANAIPAKSRKQRDAFADPLERDEWQGLGWAVSLASRLLAGSPVAQKNHRKIKEVERFTEVARAGTVCVS